tara:strand:- start:2120 stop:2395 length:276 start_codon:yes stop_codon:yes gene_type:complete
MIQQTIKELTIKTQSLENKVIELQEKLKEANNREDYGSVYEVQTSTFTKSRTFHYLSDAVHYYQELALQYVHPPIMHKVDVHLDLNTRERV